MSNSRTSRKTVVGIIRWIILPTAALMGGGLLVSNVVMQTRTARGWFERKLEVRSGLEWTIGSLSWTPWTGVQVGDLKAELTDPHLAGAEPLYQVKEMDVLIHWRSLLKRKVALREVRLRKGRVAIPLELMSLLPKQEKPPAEPARTAKEDVMEEPAKPDQEETTKEPGAKNPGAKKTAKNEPGKKPQDGPPLARPTPEPPFSVSLQDFEIHLYSISGGAQKRLALVGLEADLPLAGGDAEGWVATKGFMAGREVSTEGFRSTLQWKRPFLFLPAISYEWAGLEVQVGGSLRTRNAPLCNLEVRIKPGPIAPTPVLGVPGLELAAGRVELSARFRGNLNDMQSWQGDSAMEVADLRLVQAERGDERKFDLGRVIAVTRGGLLQVVDARLLSERLSFLGNGVALADGRVVGVLRVVADRENAEAITKVAVGSFIAGGWTRSWFIPLVTPDRQYRDINVRGSMSKAVVDVGKEGEEMEVDQAWQRMMAFVKSEVDETKRGVLPSPPRERIFPQ